MKRDIPFLFILLVSLFYTSSTLAKDLVAINHLEVEYGKQDDEELYGFSGSVYAPIKDRFYLQLEIGRLEFSKAGTDDISSYLIARNSKSLFAVGYRYQELASFTSHHAVGQMQYYQDEIFGVAGTLGYEDKNLDDDRAYGAIYLRLYPTEYFLVQTGPSLYDTTNDGFRSEFVELDLQLEWQPRNKNMNNFTLFYEESLFNKKTIGIRYRPGNIPLIRKNRSGGVLSP